MTPDARDQRPADEGSAGAANPDATPPEIVVQRLVAVPWRHAGLIAVCALAGGLASATLWTPPAPLRVAVVKPRVQPIQDAPAPPTARIELRLDLDPVAAAAASAATRIAASVQASPARLRLDDASWSDAIEAALRQAPPAAGRLPRVPSDRATGPGGERARPAWPGLVAGLLLGLLVAARRELGGERMRSPREAQWALGAPVLGAIPTLSAKARAALLEPPAAAPDAA